MIVRVRPMLMPVFAAVLASSCAGSDTLTEDRSPRPARSVDAMPSARPTNEPQFASISAALDFIRSKVDVPVVLPTGLPAGVRLPRDNAVSVARFEGVSEAQLNLKFPHGYLVILYGRSAFDGCGGDHAYPVRIGRHHGMLNPIEKDFSEIIWPASPDDLRGRYGLSGRFSPKEILQLARSMDVAVQAARRAPPTPSSSPEIGC